MGRASANAYARRRTGEAKSKAKSKSKARTRNQYRRGGDERAGRNRAAGQEELDDHALRIGRPEDPIIDAAHKIVRFRHVRVPAGGDAHAVLRQGQGNVTITAFEQHPPLLDGHCLFLEAVEHCQEERAGQQFLAALVHVIDPELRRSVVELDMVREVRVDAGVLQEPPQVERLLVVVRRAGALHVEQRARVEEVGEAGEHGVLAGGRGGDR